MTEDPIVVRYVPLMGSYKHFIRDTFTNQLVRRSRSRRLYAYTSERAATRECDRLNKVFNDNLMVPRD